MTIYTLGFTQKNAAEFFNLIRSNGIEVLIDIRLNNKSQLAGFTKGTDLSFFLKEICNCKYQHCIEFAPTKDILDNYKKGSISWSEYEKSFIPLITQRNVVDSFIKKFGNYPDWNTKLSALFLVSTASLSFLSSSANFSASLTALSISS